MAQSTTNLGKIHVFPSETLYNQFKDIIADNDLALLKDDGAYIVAALLEQNGYVKFSNGLILQWGVKTSLTDSWTYYPIPFTSTVYGILGQQTAARVTAHAYFDDVDLIKFHYKVTQYDTYPTFQTEAAGWFLAYGKQQWGIKAASTYTWTYPLPLAVVYYADMMGYRKGSAGSEYGWIRSISLIAFETYIIDESAICFCIGIAQQWGVYTTGKRNVTITLPIATSVTYAVIAVARTTNSIGCTGSQNCQYVSNVTSKTFQAGSYDAGNGYAGFWWLSISKAQALPKAHRLKHCYIPTAIQLIFVPLYVGQIIELLVLAIHDVFSNVAPDHDSCAVVIQ